MIPGNYVLGMGSVVCGPLGLQLKAKEERVVCNRLREKVVTLTRAIGSDPHEQVT